MRFDLWTSGEPGLRDEDFVDWILHEELKRKYIVWKVQNDLAKAAAGLGQNPTQIETKIDALFSTFAAEWAIYVLTGSPSIITSIQNDVTLAWLDTDISGTTIRQRLINRLT